MAKPVVDRLEQRLSGRASLVRIDVQSEAGAEIRRRYGIELVPAFLVLDRAGTVRLRSDGRIPDVEAVLAALQP